MMDTKDQKTKDPEDDWLKVTAVKCPHCGYVWTVRTPKPKKCPNCFWRIKLEGRKTIEEKTKL